MASDLSKHIGSRITLKRRKLRLTQKILSEQSGLSTGTISQIEEGLYHCRVDTLAAIASALNTSFKSLTGY